LILKSVELNEIRPLSTLAGRAFPRQPSAVPLILILCGKTALEIAANGPAAGYFCRSLVRITIMKYNQSALDKIEKVLDETGYTVRYERGNFQSGYCILEERKVVVLNKFLQMEGRINTLLDIVPQLNITADQLSPEAKKTYLEVLARLEREEK
jgi:hypothetical protein